MLVTAALACLMIGAGVLPVLAADDSQSPPMIKQEITIKGRGAVGPAVALPPPAAIPQILDEVIDSLEITQGRYEVGTHQVKLPATRRRLSVPFPGPPYLVFASKSNVVYDRWIFKILSGPEEVWSTSGEGRVVEYLDWDGSGKSGSMSAVVGEDYRFRFVGWRGAEEYSVESEPVRMDSIFYKELMGGVRLEVGNRFLFGRGARFKKGGMTYLKTLGDRMRRVRLETEPYRLILYQKKPNSRLAGKRAKALKRFFAKHLLISRTQISVSVLRWSKRGDVLVCLLPPEMGDTFKLD